MNHKILIQVLKQINGSFCLGYNVKITRDTLIYRVAALYFDRDLIRHLLWLHPESAIGLIELYPMRESIIIVGVGSCPGTDLFVESRSSHIKSIAILEIHCSNILCGLEKLLGNWVEIW